MLKWLVTKAPSSSTLENVVTDDPLATLNERKDKNEPIYAVSRVNPIFEEEDNKNHSKNVSKSVVKNSEIGNSGPDTFPDSPPTDRESVRSSGYGSKGTDSVSFKSDSPDEEELPVRFDHDLNEKEHALEGSLNLDFPRGVTEIRRSYENLPTVVNFSTDTKSSTNNAEMVTTATPVCNSKPTVEIVTQNPNFVKSIDVGTSNRSSEPLEVILEVSHESESGEGLESINSSWPRVGNLAKALERQNNRIHQRRERERLKQLGIEESENNSQDQALRFNPLVSVVAQNRRYVTAISVSRNDSSREGTANGDTQNESLSRSNFHLEKANSGVPSSLIVNNNYFNQNYPLISLQPDSLVTEDTLQMMNYPSYGSYPRKSEDLDMPDGVSAGDMPHFGRAIYSSFYSLRSGSSASQESLNSRKERNAQNYNSAKRKSATAMKDLWEKTGLKTNGRKLLVDVNDLITEERPLTHSKKPSYRSSVEDDYQSIPSTSTNSGSQLRQKKDVIRTISGRSSDTYENVSIAPNSYEEISEYGRGIDNLGFIDDRGNFLSSTTSSLHSRNGGGFGHPFQHNLTNFQRRVSERIQGEPNHRKSWLDVEKGEINLHKDDIGLHHITDQAMPKDYKQTLTKKKHDYPGKAVRELGLDSNFRRHDIRSFSNADYNDRPIGSFWTVNESPSGSLGTQNPPQIWNQFYGSCKDGSIPTGYFYPHPNSEAPICAHRGGFCHDFTLDPKKSQRMLQKSSKEKRRRMCCLCVLVIISFIAFVGAIIGLAWFSTIGQRSTGSI